MKDAFPGEQPNTSPSRVLVVGVGNRLLGDEGVGPRIVDSLSRMTLPSYVDVVDCGCDLLSIVLYLNRPKKIIVVDVIRAGGRPGRIYRLDCGRLTATKPNMRSAHQVGTADVLHLLKLACPALVITEIIVIGVEPRTMESTTDLSKEVKKSIPELMRIVFEEISAPSHPRQGETWEQVRAFA